jgi:hypothetical protein
MLFYIQFINDSLSVLPYQPSCVANLIAFVEAVALPALGVYVLFVKAGRHAGTVYVMAGIHLCPGMNRIAGDAAAVAAFIRIPQADVYGEYPVEL